MSIKNVVLVGAGGNLGPAVLTQLLKAKFNVTVLTRKSSKSTFPSEVKIATVSDDYPFDELVKAFSGQDAVVSTIAGLESAKQVALVDAAVKAGVKRFIPAEFGSDRAHEDESFKSISIFNEKEKAAERLIQAESEGLTWTSIVNGPFLDWGLKVGFLGLNLQDKTARIANDGNARFSATALSQVGLAVTRILERPEKTANQTLHIQSTVTTQNELLNAAEKLTGDKWTVTKVDLKEFVPETLPKAQAGDIGAAYGLIWAHIVGGSDEIFSEKKVGFGNPILGLEEESIQPYVEEWIKG